MWVRLGSGDQFGKVVWMGAKTVSRLKSVLETEAEALRLGHSHYLCL